MTLYSCTMLIILGLSEKLSEPSKPSKRIYWWRPEGVRHDSRILDAHGYGERGASGREG
jgi:hypothetical protein